MQLLERYLPERDLAVCRAAIRRRDVSGFDGAFLSSARGIAVVSAIDDIELDEARSRVAVLRDVYETVPWDRI